MLGIKVKQVKTPFLGPSYTNKQIKNDLEKIKIVNNYLEEEELIDFVVSELNKGKIIGWLQGRAEFGPRALGNKYISIHPWTQK